jgi:hypothetical protein
VFRATSKNDHERSAKPHSTHPLSVIGWNTIYFGFDECDHLCFGLEPLMQPLRLGYGSMSTQRNDHEDASTQS